jgi:hypothetical protein
MELRDAGSDEMIYYRDVSKERLLATSHCLQTNGEYTAEKSELVYMGLWTTLSVVQLLTRKTDFKPKIAGQQNRTVDYTVTTCK